MSWHLAPSLVQLQKEVNRRWPNRSKSSDGTIGDASHAARKSDHNPNARGSVNAFDITYPGVDPAIIIAAVKKHPSASYVIFNGSIYSKTNDWKKAPYSGASQHKEHLHVSILQTVKAEKDLTPWLAGVAVKPKKPRVPAYPGAKQFQVGDKGPHVKLVQTALGNKPTGTMTKLDVAGVKRFQKVRPRLWPADGVVGPKTYAALAATKNSKAIYR